jgi:hypothetical protein
MYTYTENMFPIVGQFEETKESERKKRMKE